MKIELGCSVNPKSGNYTILLFLSKKPQTSFIHFKFLKSGPARVGGDLQPDILYPMEMEEMLNQIQVGNFEAVKFKPGIVP